MVNLMTIYSCCHFFLIYRDVIFMPKENSKKILQMPWEILFSMQVLQTSNDGFYKHMSLDTCKAFKTS